MQNPVNPIQDRGAKKALPTIFSLATSTKVWINPQKILTFVFNPFATLMQDLKVIPST